MRLNEFTQQSVQEDSGYDSSEPLDLGKNPSVKLGRHPEPNLPEAYEPVDRPHGTYRSGIFSPNRGIARRSLTAVTKFLEKPFNSHQRRTDFLLSLVPDRNLKELVGVLAYEHFPFDDLREKPWFMRRLNSLIARAEQRLNQDVAEGRYDNRDAYQRDYDNSQTNFGRGERDSERPDIDTNNEYKDAHGTWYIRIDGIIEPTPYTGKAAANAAGVALKKLPGNENKLFMLTTKA